MKQCAKCGKAKSLEYFSVNRRSVDGKADRCKDCVNEYTRERYLNTMIIARTPQKKLIRFEGEVSQLNALLEEVVHDFAAKQRKLNAATEDRDICLRTLTKLEEDLKKLKIKICALKSTKVVERIPNEAR